MESKKFNKYFKNFLTFLHNAGCLKSVDSVEESNYATIYVSNILPYMEEISLRNSDYFTYSDRILIRKLKYKHVFGKIDKSQMDDLWKNLQSLYIRGSSNLDVSKLLESLELDEETRDRCRNVLKSHNTILLNFVNEQQPTMSAKEAFTRATKKKEKSKFPKDLNNMTQEEEDDFLNGTLIGNLAKDLASGINPDDVSDLSDPKDLIDGLMSGGLDLSNPSAMEGGLGHIIKTVVGNLDSKINENDIDKTQLFKEAQQLLGGLNLGPGAFAGMAGMGGGTAPPSQQTENKNVDDVD